MIFKKILVASFAAFFVASPFFAADVSISEEQRKPAAEKPAAEAPKESPATAFVRQLSAALQSGSLEEALALFDKIPDSLKDDFDLQKLRISLLISAQRYNEASKILAELEPQNPKDIELKELKMMLAKATGNASTKSAVLQEIIKLDPTNSSANTELGQEQVLKRKYKNAKTYYAKALQGDPQNIDALFGYGQTSYYLNEIDNARNAFDKMIDLDPENAIAYAYIGKLYGEDENYKLAEEYVLKAIALDSENYDFYMDLGTYQRFRGKFKDAEKAWTNAIRVNPDYFLAYAYRAGLYDEQDMYDQALEDYRMVVKTNPKYYFAYEALGMLAWRIENYDEAREAFETAYSYAKTNVSYPLMIAACYYKAAKTPSQASAFVKPFLQKVMKDFPDHNSIEYLMLRLYHDLGPTNAENLVTKKIQEETSSNKKGKMTFYLALFDEIMKRDELAKKLYAEITSLQSPMFFEFRLAEWKVQ